MLEHLGIGITLTMQDDFSPKADTAVASMNRLEQGADHLHRSMGESMSSLQNLMLSGFSMGQIGEKFDSFGSHIVGSFKKAYSDLAQVGSKFENFKIRFDTFFREMSDKKLEWGLKFAEKTPFRLEETLDAMTSFKVMGMDVDKQFQTTIKNGKELHSVTKDMMTALGDIGALKPEQGIAGAMYAIREWYGGSKRSFKNRFEVDPEQALGRKINTSNPDQFMKDWIEFSEKKAPGLLNKLSDSWLTITDNIEDAFQILKYKISKQDVFKSVKKTAKDFYLFLNNIDVDKLGKTVGSALSAIWKPIDLIAHGLMKLTVGIMNFSSAHPVLTKVAVGFIAINGVVVSLVGKLLKLSGGFLILTTSMVSAYTNLKLLNTFSDLSKIFSGLGRGLQRLAYTLKLVGLVSGAFAIAWHTNFMGMRDSTTNMINHFTTSWGNAKKALDQGINSSVLRIIGWKGMATQMGIPFDNLTRSLMKLQLVGTIIKTTLFGDVVNGELQYTTKELQNLESMGLIPLAQTFALLRGRVSGFFKGLAQGLGTTWGMIKEYGSIVLKPIKVVLEAIGVNLDNIKNAVTSIFGIKDDNGLSMSLGESQISNAKNLGKALGGVLGVMLGFKAVRMITPIILAPFRALNRTLTTSMSTLNRFKRLMSKVGMSNKLKLYAMKHPFSPIGKAKRIKDRTNRFMNEYSAVPVLGKKDKNGYQRVNGGLYGTFRNYGLKSNPSVKNVDDLYAKEKVKGLGKLFGYQYYQRDKDGAMKKVGSYGGRLKMGRDNAQNKLFAQLASKNNYNALGSYQVRGHYEVIKDKEGKPVLDGNGKVKKRYVPTTTAKDVYAYRSRIPKLDKSVGTMNSLFKGVGFGKLSETGKAQLQDLRLNYEKQLRDLVRENRGTIEARTGKKLNMRSFNVPPGMDDKLESNIKTFKKMLRRSGVDVDSIKRQYSTKKGDILRNSTLAGGSAQVFESKRGKVRTALFGKSYYKVNRDEDGNLYKQVLGKQGGIFRNKSKDLFSGGQVNLQNANLNPRAPKKDGLITRFKNSSVADKMADYARTTTSRFDSIVNAGASRLGRSFIGRGFGRATGKVTGVINSQRSRLGLAPLSRPTLPQGRNAITRVAKGGWSVAKGASNLVFGRSRLEAIKDGQGNIIGRRRVGGGLISRGVRGGSKVVRGAGKLLGGAGSLALGLTPYVALGTMAFKGMTARGSRIGKDKKRMTELFGKDFAKQKRSPIEIMLKDAENRMRKVNPNQLYAKFRAGAKKTFPIIKQIAITAFRQLNKVLPSILKDAWTGIKAGAKLAWIWIKTDGVRMLGQFVAWMGAVGVPKLIQGAGKFANWMLGTGIPKLIQLGGKFFEWVINKGIPTLIKGLVKFEIWVITVGLPTLGKKVIAYIPTIASGIFHAIVNGLKGLPGAILGLLGSGIKSLPVIGKPIASMLGFHHGGLWMSPNEHPAIIRKDETVLPPALSKRFNELFTTASPAREKFNQPTKVINVFNVKRQAMLARELPNVKPIVNTFNTKPQPIPIKEVYNTKPQETPIKGVRNTIKPTPIVERTNAKPQPTKVDSSVHIGKVELIVKADKLSRADARKQAKLILDELKSMQKEENIRTFA